MKMHALRLATGTDLKAELARIVSEEKIQAGVILACVGSLSKAVLRMAGATPGKQDVRTYDEVFEVVSLTGTLSQAGMHVHMSISNKEGVCVGGHLKNGCIVKTTMELVIGESEEHVFSQEKDPKTGFDEIVITKK